ncbi:MAG: aminotransferase class III-fold pyridoxal phosphate-dependent enzyme [Deltaproteobacteria bacterium]|jgi:4-aminobutyrate aminotransferase|nr:aminotransferase class III-fold pyridoxal phosphate-dependent enzyme [Deltaproteobacteria bacterium]MBW2533397.1 aminotransferase class III-fold pyridoxal phosphate-dependent enzyme [Deltaproteobacteria bacterium]
MKRPTVQSSLPGPKTKAIVERGDKRGSLPTSRPYPLVVDHAEGVWVTDPDGNELLDMTAGGGVAVVGHVHPAVVEAIQTQVGKLCHYAPSHVSDPVQVDLAERLAKLGATRGKGHRVFLGASGSDAVRAAVELARHHTERETVLAFTNSMQGPDLDGVAVSRSKVIEASGLAPLVSGMFNTGYPDPLRHGDEAIANSLEHVLTILGKLVSPENVAGVLVEPIQLEGGMVVPPRGFLAALRRLCDQHDMLLMVNEIHTGLGRTGKMFGWQHEAVEPDMVCLAGGLAGGLPIGALIARTELMGWPAETRPSTFGGNPVACAAGLRVLDLLEGGLIEQANARGDALLSALTKAVGEHPKVGEIRGRGLISAVELVSSKEELGPAPMLRNTVLQDCYRKGLLAQGCGPSTIALAPALTVNEEEIGVAVEIFAEVLEKASE